MELDDIKFEMDLFNEVLEHPTEQRQAFIVARCGDAPDMADRLRKLLKGHERAEAAVATLGMAAQVAEEIPTEIDSFRIVEKLGEGGMGVVYVAEQTQPVRRRVAVKLVRSGVDSAEVITRFHAERQALALMNHKNIAQILDAGVFEGRPYFVMELITGEPITEYCNRCALPIADRLRLFIDVCQGVQHAHQKGVIHRDLKPPNVLVTEQDGRPLPKIIDFGIAKAVEHRLTDHTMVTQHGHLIGTPSYMSPEQAGTNAFDIDTRCDVYSLGALLYELLTGRTPLRFQSLDKMPLHEVMRVIREEEPIKPSKGLATGVERESEAAGRFRTESRKLATILRGELDWIVMKSLEKDRDRRYASVADLAEDIQRHLTNQPVLAGPPSNTYRARKFVRRHKGTIVVSALGVLALAAAAVVSAVFAISESEQRRTAEAAAEALREQTMLAEELRAQAETERDTALGIVRFLNDDLIGSVRPSIVAGEGRNVSMRDVLDAASKRIETRTKPGGLFGDKPIVEAGIRAALGGAYHELSAYEEAEHHLARSFALYVAHLGDDHPKSLSVLTRLGPVYLSLGRIAKAEKYYTESVSRHIRAYGRSHLDTLGAIANMGVFLKAQGKLDESETYYREAYRGLRDLFGDDHEHTLVAADNLAILLSLMNHKDEAERLSNTVLNGFRRTLGRKHPRTLKTMNNYASILVDLNRHQEAERILEEAVASTRDIYGSRHDSTATALNTHATALRKLGRLEEAERAFREALAINRSVLGEDHPSSLIALSNLAGVLRDVGEFDQASRLSSEAVERSSAAFAQGHWIQGVLRVRHAESLLGLGRFSEASEQAEVGYAIIEGAMGSQASRTRDAAGVLAEIHEQWELEEPGSGHAALAREWHERKREGISDP